MSGGNDRERRARGELGKERAWTTTMTTTMTTSYSLEETRRVKKTNGTGRGKVEEDESIENRGKGGNMRKVNLYVRRVGITSYKSLFVWKNIKCPGNVLYRGTLMSNVMVMLGV